MTRLPWLLLLVLATGCEGPKPDGRSRGGMKRPPVAVSTVPVARRDLSEKVELTGTLEAFQQVAIAAHASGRLVDVVPRLGDRVVQGQIVAQLDDRELKARLDQAEATLASAQATLKLRQIDQANLQTQAERDKTLFKREFIAKQEMENSQAKAAGADALVQLARAEVARQQAGVQEAQTQLAKVFIRSPLTGVVSLRHLEPGSMASPGTPILSVVTPGSLKTVVQVSERMLPRLRVGQQAAVTVDAWPGSLFSGRVSRLSPVIQPETRTGAVELAIQDLARKLRPGMFARVGLTLETHAGVPTLPRQALVKQQNVAGVFVPKDGKARFVPVILGMTSGDRVELIDGPPVGSRVVTLGNHLLKDGSDIQMSGKRRREPH